LASSGAKTAALRARDSEDLEDPPRLPLGICTRRSFRTGVSCVTARDFRDAGRVWNNRFAPNFSKKYRLRTLAGIGAVRNLARARLSQDGHLCRPPPVNDLAADANNST